MKIHFLKKLYSSNGNFKFHFLSSSSLPEMGIAFIELKPWKHWKTLRIFTSFLLYPGD